MGEKVLDLLDVENAERGANNIHSSYNENYVKEMRKKLLKLVLKGLVGVGQRLSVGCDAILRWFGHIFCQHSSQ